MDLVHLQKNEHLFPHCPDVARFFSDYSQNWLNLYSDAGSENFYKSLADFYHLEPQNFFVASGFETTLLLTLAQLKIHKNVSHIVIPDVCWDYYQVVANRIALEIISVATLAGTNGTHIIDDQDFNNKTNGKNYCVLICSPNNPSGMIFDVDRLRFLMTKFNDHFFIIDEAYVGFSSISPIKSYFFNNRKISSNVIIGRSFSKFFGLPGLRIGYVILDQNLRSRLKLDPLYLGLTSISEQVGIIVLKNFNWYEKQADEISKTRDWFIEMISKIEGWKAYPSKANFILVDVGNDDGKQIVNSCLENGFSVKLCGLPFLNHLRITITDRKALNKLLVFLQKK